MTNRRQTIDPSADTPGAEQASALRHHHDPDAAVTARLTSRPHSAAEAEERYITARASWADAMRAAGSGRASDLASLAIAQEAYEAALAERERWANSPRMAIPVEPDRSKGLEAIVGQEMVRRAVHEHEGRPEPKGLRRLFRRKPNS